MFKPQQIKATKEEDKKQISSLNQREVREAMAG